MPQGSNNEVVEQRTCIDGVNEQVAAASKNQCIDARNVWERGGRVVQRPGSQVVRDVVGSITYADDYGPLPKPYSPPDLPGSINDFTFAVDAGAGAVLQSHPFTFNITAAPMALYIGSHVPFSAVLLNGGGNAAAATTNIRYWNGTWALPFQQAEYTSGTPWTAPVRSFLGTQVQLNARVGSDWLPTTIAGQWLYWWRIFFTGVGGGASATFSSPENHRLLAGAEASPTGTPFIQRSNYATSSRWHLVLPFKQIPACNYVSTESLYDSTRWVKWGKPWGDMSRQASAAVDVQGGRTYLAYNNHITKHRATPQQADDILAKVETADWAIGPGAPYDQSSIALLKAFPAASLITWFQNRLWFGAIDGEPNAVRWSAAAPYNEVIPALAVEYIDQPPTAMKPLGENMVIYTQDNIYLSVQDSVDDFGVPHYKFLKVVAGRGCVAQNSVVEINGRHIFLSEDGLYAFDGTSNIKKITLQSTFTSLGVSLAGSLDRLESTFRSVNTAARGGASAVHWRRERVALFSIPVNGSTSNNMTVVWDYERDKFWLWDGIQPQFWLSDNGVGYDETIYFSTAEGKVVLLDELLQDDAGVGISTYLVTSPIGLRDSMHKGLTEIKALAANTTEELTISSWPNGISSQAKSGLLKFDDYNASKVGTGVIGTMKVSPVNIRFRHTHFKTDGSYFLVKVAGGGTAAKPFDLVNLDIRYTYKYVDTR